jgi:excinuclease ABC subunit A
MQRGRDAWRCPSCGETAHLAQPRHFNPGNYAAACLTCHGVGTLRKPSPDKLVVHPEKPLCGGAMYSPGFFPKGYLCKPFNGGYYVVQALAKRYGFDPATTPWDEMSPEAQHAFLFGDPEPMQIHYESKKGRTSTRTGRYPGFYGWVGDWDVGGTYTDTQLCPECGGGKLRPVYAAVTLNGHHFQGLSEMPLSRLHEVLEACARHLPQVPPLREVLEPSLRTALRRTRFLLQVGLGYMHLNRPASSFSAGEAQRIKLAGLLGSGLTSLTVLLDEPTRGLHPSEVDALVGALTELRDEGNTVIVVEHDPELIRAADYLIDVGPGAGAAGGEIVAQGTPEQVSRADTATARWLRGERRPHIQSRRAPSGWMTIRGARANNLQGIDSRFPLGTLVGVCGVSGSGKSTLLIDTLGRALAPKKQTTSVAYEEIDPGEHEAIEGAPGRVILVDQSKRGVRSPANYLGLNAPLHKLYAQSEDAQALGLDEKQLGQRCSACRGSGSNRVEMGFLPDVFTPCDACGGTGYRPEAWEVRLRGVALPDVFAMTIDQVYDLFAEQGRLARPLAAAREVGLGYLVLRQPGYALSGGEAQRLKVVKELCRKVGANADGTLYILDEPTVGQHMEDVARLTGVLHRLVDGSNAADRSGRAARAHGRNSVIVVEHHPHLLVACDWLIELGPGGGPDGGRVIATGTPEAIAIGDTPTAPFLREILEDVR